MIEEKYSVATGVQACLGVVTGAGCVRITSKRLSFTEVENG
jgi:hypothetical protein